MIGRRQLVQAGLAAPLLSAFGARAQSLPLEQPRFVFGFPPGSAGDVCVRRIAEKVGGSAYAKNPPLVENKVGAGGRIAMEYVKGLPADGSTLVFTPAACTAVFPHVYTKLAYDMAKDFAPVSLAAVIHHGLAVGPLVPASVTDVKSFLAWAKANPDKANYGSPGAGSTPHFVGALLGMAAGVELRHVPYRGSVPGVADLVGGSLAAMVTPSGDFLANHRAGKIRLIATSGKQRSPFSKEVGTFAEQGFPDLQVEEWYGFFAPIKTPASVVQAANTAIATALKDPALVEGIGTFGLLPLGSTVEEAVRGQREMFERWGPLVKKVGFTAES